MKPVKYIPFVKQWVINTGYAKGYISSFAQSVYELYEKKKIVSKYIRNLYVNSWLVKETDSYIAVIQVINKVLCNGSNKSTYNNLLTPYTSNPVGFIYRRKVVEFKAPSPSVTVNGVLVEDQHIIVNGKKIYRGDIYDNLRISNVITDKSGADTIHNYTRPVDADFRPVGSSLPDIPYYKGKIQDIIYDSYNVVNGLLKKYDIKIQDKHEYGLYESVGADDVFNKDIIINSGSYEMDFEIKYYKTQRYLEDGEVKTKTFIYKTNKYRTIQQRVPYGEPFSNVLYFYSDYGEAKIVETKDLREFYIKTWHDKELVFVSGEYNIGAGQYEEVALKSDLTYSHSFRYVVGQIYNSREISDYFVQYINKKDHDKYKDVINKIKYITIDVNKSIEVNDKEVESKIKDLIKEIDVNELDRYNIYIRNPNFYKQVDGLNIRDDNLYNYHYDDLPSHISDNLVIAGKPVSEVIGKSIYGARVRRGGELARVKLIPYLFIQVSDDGSLSVERDGDGSFYVINDQYTDYEIIIINDNNDKGEWKKAQYAYKSQDCVEFYAEAYRNKLLSFSGYCDIMKSKRTIIEDNIGLSDVFMSKVYLEGEYTFCYVNE